MALMDIATLTFLSSEESLAILRAAPNQVALALSLRSAGDVEVFLDADEAQKLLDALTAAVATARGRTA
jgi:hypothetical protein